LAELLHSRLFFIGLPTNLTQTREANMMRKKGGGPGSKAGEKWGREEDKRRAEDARDREEKKKAEREKEQEGPGYSVCHAEQKGLWFWAVWKVSSKHEAFEHGYAGSRKLALDAAREKAGIGAKYWLESFASEAQAMVKARQAKKT